MKYILLSISFLLISSFAQAKVIGLGCYYLRDGNYTFTDLGEELEYIRGEFGYYANKFNDDSGFPKAREQELLQHIENNYLMKGDYTTLYHGDSLLGYAPNPTFAKLLLSYGGDVLSAADDDNNYYDYLLNPLRLLVERNDIDRAFHRIPDLPHDEISNLVRKPHIYWSTNLPDSNVLTLAKLYISLGVKLDVKNEAGGNAIVTSSLYWLNYEHYGMEEGRKRLEALFAVPDDKHRADDIRKPCDEDGGDYEVYYIFFRTPVTYWLEEFIEAGYPASMLDTHRLHYPRFMKDASVAQVMDMLNNPETHKIPANINCPYKETCSLIPSINMRDAMGRTPLHIAGEQGNQEVFNALIKIGADKSVKDFRGNVPRY